MKNSALFPPGFSRGIPTEEGTYVLLTNERGGYELHVREIQNVPIGQAGQLGVNPGLCVIDDFEAFCYWAVEDCNIVGYMKLEGVSAFELWNHQGPLETDDLQLTDQAIDDYLAKMRKHLEGIVFERGSIDLEKLPAGLRADGLEPYVVFEDRKRCVDMWRRNGITCLQVAEGDF